MRSGPIGLNVPEGASRCSRFGDIAVSGLACGLVQLHRAKLFIVEKNLFSRIEKLRPDVKAQASIGHIIRNDPRESVAPPGAA